jgi:5-(carboxyamino)imidazole ribonucleotide synthase
MTTFEAVRMGYRVHVLDPDPDGPAGPIATSAIAAPFDDEEGALRLAERSDVVTIDTEHIPAAILGRIEETLPVRPGASVLRTIQDRLVQRRFLESVGAPQPRWRGVETLADVEVAAAEFGGASIVKSRHAGYDGKGQARLGAPADAGRAWAAIGAVPAVLEAVVPFDRELSVLLARDVRGDVRIYPLAENVHRRHILHSSLIPTDVGGEVRREAETLGGAIAGALGLVGMMAVELFLVGDRTLLVNEIAPRTHNSGHATFGGATVSQFEQHVRAVCGLRLGDPVVPHPAVIVNLLGDLWADGEPRWEQVLNGTDARLHLYGKRSAAPGRKMGHVLVVRADARDARREAEAIHRRLEALASGAPMPSPPATRPA